MKILNHNWDALDFKAGTKYAIGVTIVLVLSLYIEFSWFAVGVSAMLAWIIPGQGRDRLVGIAIYIVGGVALTFLVAALGDSYWPWLISMIVVAFLGTFAMIEGPRGFMVGWCLICWFYVAPILGTAQMPMEILSAHLLGSVVMLILVALPFGQSAEAADAGEPAPPAERPSVSFVASYAATVAIVMTIGVALGHLWLKTDPTLILQASLMIMMPSATGTWVVAVDRMIGLVLGVVIGFYLGQMFGGLTLEIIVWIVASFLLVSTMNVNAAPMVFFFVLPFSVVWGTMEPDAGHFAANERLIAELIGVVLAGIAVSSRETLLRKFSPA